MRQMTWKIIPIVLFLLLSVFLWRGLFLNPHYLPSMQIGKKIPQFKLPQLQNPNIYFHSSKLHNQITLLNVWASWCSSCIEEQAFLLQLAREHFPIYGLNYKDKPSDALHWLAEWGNPYREVFQDRKGSVAIDLGVYGAPETFLIDQEGVIRYRHAGIMTQKVWSEEIVPLIKSLEKIS